MKTETANKCSNDDIHQEKKYRDLYFLWFTSRESELSPDPYRLFSAFL